MRLSTFCLAIALVTVVLPLAVADSVAPGGPVTNGGFENPFVPSQVYDAFEGSPADTCIGIGHQVLWGEESTQHQVTGDKSPAENGEPEVDPNNVFPVIVRFADSERPVEEIGEEATYQAGLGHCVFSNEEGKDLVWLSPGHRSNAPIAWSTANTRASTVFSYEADDDPFDREARIIGDGSLSGHNLWQSFAGKQQVYTANFDTYTFTIENWDELKALDQPLGTGAQIQLSFSVSPMQEQNPWVGVFVDGTLRFKVDTILENIDEDGVVRLDPTEDLTDVICRGYPPCLEIKDDLESDDTDEESKRATLGRLRLVQNSFWAFNKGPADVVIDDVAIDGYTTVVDEAATGNVNPNTPESA